MKSSGEFEQDREAMVRDQIEGRGITDPRVIAAMRKVPRHLFVPEDVIDQAYADQAITLGPGQSISQPYVVALMLEALNLKSTDRVLDVGTGSGYQTALLSELVKSVWTIEIDPALSLNSKNRLEEIGYNKITYSNGDGWLGWPEEAPFDAIIVSAAAESVPRELIRQLVKGSGRIVLPLGTESQFLVLFENTTEGLISKDLGSVQFVPLRH